MKHIFFASLMLFILVAAFAPRISAQTKPFTVGEVLIYEIDELSEDSVLMRPKDSRGPFRNYRKRD